MKDPDMCTTIRTNLPTNAWSSPLQASLHIYEQAANVRGYIGGISNAYRGISTHWAREAEKARTDPSHPFGYSINKIRDSYSSGLILRPATRRMGSSSCFRRTLRAMDLRGSVMVVRRF